MVMAFRIVMMPLAMTVAVTMAHTQADFMAAMNRVTASGCYCDPR